MNKFRSIYLLVLIGIVFLYGCKKSENIISEYPIQVVVQKVTFSDFKEDLTYSGTIEESLTVPLNFSTIGTVSLVLVSEGDMVHKGDLLASLDNTSYQHTYEMALAAEQQAEDAYKRLTPMHENNTLPDIKYVEITTKLQQAKAATAIAKKNLDDCNLYATIDGFVGKRAIEQGMTALSNMASITLVKIDKVYARIPVPENEISSIRKGDKALILVKALDSREYAGLVEEIGVVADMLAHTYNIKISIINKDGALKPGMICNAVLQHTGTHSRLVIPNQAIMTDEMGRQFVYVADSTHQKAIRKNITIRNYVRDGIEITQGLKENDLVITEGQHKLVDQTMISIKTEE